MKEERIPNDGIRSFFLVVLKRIIDCFFEVIELTDSLI